MWQDYGGISAERLEVLEERLRDDVVSELHSFGGKYVHIFRPRFLGYFCKPKPRMAQ